MATLLIRNLDDAIRDKLRVRAATRGRSMEEEARTIIAGAIEQQDEVDPNSLPGSGATLLAALRKGLPPGGVDFGEFPDQVWEPEPIWEDEAE